MNAKYFLYKQKENFFHIKMQKIAVSAIRTIFESAHHVEQIYNSCQAVITRSTSGTANKSQREQTRFSKMLSTRYWITGLL